MSQILCYGSLNLDYVYHIPHFVTPGETLSAFQRNINCGGKGLNQSVAAARAGASVCHAGKIGHDGNQLAEMLRSSGVDTSLLAQSSTPNGHAIIQVDAEGQNCILLYGGSNQEITHAEVDRAFEPFGAGDFLILQNEINALDYIMEQAAKRGISIVFNPSPIDEKLFQLPLHLVSLMIFNEVEGAALAGSSDDEQILNCLRERLPHCCLLLTLGSRGCIYDSGCKRIHQGAYQTQVVDTTAAGDTFTGYFVAGLSMGMSEEVCLELAARAAAIAISRPGAAPSIPTMDEVRNTALSLN